MPFGRKRFWMHSNGRDYFVQRRFAFLRYVNGTLICMQCYWAQTTSPKNDYANEYLYDPSQDN